ncbi:hypothetical protein L7F22_023635 [Adiantum nelumboides]|nr:hypothetical protein [Adiantum nelumboides]
MAKSAIMVGPWGGSGGDAFDDGWNNGGVSNLTIYYDGMLRGIKVAYGNGTNKLHGSEVGSTQKIDFSSSAATTADIAVVVGCHSAFSGDPNNEGIVALGAVASTVPYTVPTSQNGDVYRPQVIGFFGSSGTCLDRLGLYLSNSATL